ncbi:MAG: efflux RND transporter periplasmic adaptor subunit [Planctomycetes bacterium]|nr:efflux RND transporter periplasmic adaptor subunit [Planctomycetota bacterium]
MIMKDTRLFCISRPGRIRQQILPLLVWMAAVAGAAMLFYHGSQRFEVVGIAQTEARQVSVNCTGRLKTLSVQLFDKVAKDQNLAIIDTVLDNENIHAELAVVSAEIERLKAELATTEDSAKSEATSIESDRMAAKRRFAVDVENARLQILQLKTIIETGRLAMKNILLDKKIAVVRSTTDINETVYYEQKKIDGEYNLLAGKIKDNERLLAQAEQDLNEATNRSEQFDQNQPFHPSVDNSLNVIRKAIKVQEQRVEQLHVKGVPVVLKSPIAGVVSTIAVRPGETVLPGSTIMTIAEDKPVEVLAYAREDQINEIREGTTVELIKQTPPAQIARTQVFYVGPVVEQMPMRLWRNPNLPQWGRPFLVRVPSDMKLRPGETVGVKTL